MLTNQVPSLQAIIIAHLSPDTISEITESFVIPTLPTLKERINIRVLGTPNPIKIATDEELLVEKIERLGWGVHFGYIHPAVSSFGNKSPRTRRLNKQEPEKTPSYRR